MLDLPVGHGGKPGEDVAQVGVGIDAASTTTLDDGVKDGAAVTGVGIAQEQPVLLSEGGGPNRVFHEVIVDLQAALFQIDTEEWPVGERVIDVD